MCVQIQKQYVIRFMLFGSSEIGMCYGIALWRISLKLATVSTKLNSINLTSIYMCTVYITD